MPTKCCLLSLLCAPPEKMIAPREARVECSAARGESGARETSTRDLSRTWLLVDVDTVLRGGSSQGKQQAESASDRGRSLAQPRSESACRPGRRYGRSHRGPRPHSAQAAQKVASRGAARRAAASTCRTSRLASRESHTVPSRPTGSTTAPVGVDVHRHAVQVSQRPGFSSDCEATCVGRAKRAGVREDIGTPLARRFAEGESRSYG